METKLWFWKICQKNGIEISDFQIELLDNFQTLLLEWNKKINLISRKNEQNIWSQHILASIAFHSSFKLRKQTSTLDLGTGGGLPGIPLAILRPDIEVTLLDSIQKKMKAVEEIISILGLPNAKAVCGRAEEISKDKKYYCKFDYVIARAVASANDIIKWGKPFLRSHKQYAVQVYLQQKQADIEPGSLIMLKGGELTKEIEEAKIKHRPRSILVHQIVLEGVEEADLTDKKLVIVKP
jgi:16S rRNA (guanine527-N7)-methyltransferase